MRIYFSGGNGLLSTPEALAADRKPHIMLTYYDIESNGTLDRLNCYLERKYGKIHHPKDKDVKLPSSKVEHPLHVESLFMDSGAFSLYGLHILKASDKIGRASKGWGMGDYSYYTLAPGSEFRKYCDRYGKFIRSLKHTDILFTTVDAIQNPQVSWHIQEYFEKEHGVKPIPVVHSATPHGVRWLSRYIDKGHTIIGLGGLAQNVRIDKYRPWANELFRFLCPKSNDYKPIVRIHGFAMTSWELMVEWPWWSVDSTSWIKYAAYGWILVPPWDKKKKQFRHDVPPLQINLSRKPTERKHRYEWQVGSKSPRQQKDKHYDNCKLYYRESTDRWLEHLGIPIGEFRGEELQNVGLGAHMTLNPEKFEVVEDGVASDFKLRAKANLQYYADFQASRPKWPCPLREEVINEAQRVQYRHGLGIL